MVLWAWCFLVLWASGRMIFWASCSFKPKCLDGWSSELVAFQGREHLDGWYLSLLYFMAVIYKWMIYGCEDRNGWCSELVAFSSPWVGMNDILSYLHFQVCSRMDGWSSGLLAFSKGRERRDRWYFELVALSRPWELGSMILWASCIFKA
jgi:hypothetical protein